MSTNPLVSVLMSVYNGDRYLNEAVESILSQTYEDFEFIIINDGSTDQTKEILSSFSEIDHRIRVFHQENHGLIFSLNKGLELARGKYVARMDADDISLPRRLEEQINYLRANPDVGVLGTQMEIINENGKKIGKYQVPCSHNLIIWQVLFGRPFAHPSVMFKKSIIEQVGGYSKKYTHAEDLELWSRLVGKTQFRNLSESLCKYRALSNSISVKYEDIQSQNAILARYNLISKDS